MLAAITFDLKFTYVLAGWEGSAHDSRVLSDALSRPNGFRIPEGINNFKFYKRKEMLVRVFSFSLSSLSYL